MGRKLATGGFGSVFLGELKEADGSTSTVVVKKVCYVRQLCYAFGIRSTLTSFSWDAK